MNFKTLSLGLLLACCGSTVWGQVRVAVLLDQEQFLPGESVPVKVRIINHSGQTLWLGRDNDWLRMTVEAEDSFVVSRLGEPEVAGMFELPPSKMATKVVDIAPHFVTDRPGRYSVTATVRFQDWNQTLTSDPVEFDIINGSILWERVFGVPDSTRPDGSPEVRKYLLQQANHIRSRIVLYARVTDATGDRTLGVVPIGPMVSFSDPRALVDKDSNLHVLYQSGPRISTYFCMNPEGRPLKHERHEYSATRPRLVASEDGTVSVQGGVRVPTAPQDPPPGESTDQKDDEG